jgi:hypothetical protein
MKTLASQIERQLQLGKSKYYAASEDELKRIWPPDDQEREVKITQFAEEYGLRLQFYRKGLCAIFDKSP